MKSEYHLPTYTLPDDFDGRRNSQTKVSSAIGSVKKPVLFVNQPQSNQ